MTDGHDERVRRHAEAIWNDKGRPAGGPEAYTDEANELAAIEENLQSTLKPVENPGPYGEPIEEAGTQGNLGEFPTLTDQGEEKTSPGADDEIDPVDPVEDEDMEEIGEADREDGDDEDDDEDDEDEDDEDEEDDEDVLRTDRERPLDEVFDEEDEE